MVTFDLAFFSSGCLLSKNTPETLMTKNTHETLMTLKCVYFKLISHWVKSTIFVRKRFWFKLAKLSNLNFCAKNEASWNIWIFAHKIQISTSKYFDSNSINGQKKGVLLQCETLDCNYFSAKWILRCSATITSNKVLRSFLQALAASGLKLSPRFAVKYFSRVLQTTF